MIAIPKPKAKQGKLRATDAFKASNLETSATVALSFMMTWCWPEWHMDPQPIVL